MITPKALPEGSWRHRRIAVGVVTVSLLLLIRLAILKNSPGVVTISLCATLAWVLTLYITGASAEHVARILSLRDIMNMSLQSGLGGGMGGQPYGEVMSVPPDEVG